MFQTAVRCTYFVVIFSLDPKFDTIEFRSHFSTFYHDLKQLYSTVKSIELNLRYYNKNVQGYSESLQLSSNAVLLLSYNSLNSPVRGPKGLKQGHL